MTTPLPPQLRLNAEPDTARLANAFAQALGAGDVLLLGGGLAAGKTFFVRAAVAALGSQNQVTSPTYSLAHIYQSPKAPVLHIDAYRLKTRAEFTDLGLEHEQETSITFIEWGAILAGEFDRWLRLDLALDPADSHARTATFSAHGAVAHAQLARILAHYGGDSA